VPNYLVHGNHSINIKGRVRKVIHMRFCGEAPDEFVWLKLKHNAEIKKVKTPSSGAKDWAYPGPLYHSKLVLPDHVQKRFFSK
jgi:hypothetical protein